MKYFFQDQRVDDLAIKRLLPNELCYIKLNSQTLSPMFLESVEMSTNLSRAVYLSIPSIFLNEPGFRESILGLRLKGVVIEYECNPTKWVNQIGIGDFYSGDRDVIDHFQQMQRHLGESLELNVEIKLQEDFRVLGPTLVNLHKKGASFAVLNLEHEFDSHMRYQLSELFEYLKIRGLPRFNVYFPFWKSNTREINTKTFNTFSGLTDVHIDLSNRCTHSCLFCGLYSPEIHEDVKSKNGGKLPQDWIKVMAQEIDSDKCFSLISSLPWTVKLVQFGGAGDPLMHKNAVDFIVAARSRGFSVEALSNMEYLTEVEIQRLHEVGGENFHDLHFIVNLSGADPETYIKTRPKQTAKTFEKVKTNLKRISDLRLKSGGIGANYTLMCVVNKLNARALDRFIDLAVELDCEQVWFKPVEVHSDYHRAYLPDRKLTQEMAANLRLALRKADELSVKIQDRDVIESIIAQYSLVEVSP